MTLSILNGPVIAAGKSLSDAIDCTSGKIVRITTPSAWSPGAHLTFQISSDGQGFNDLYRQGEEVVIPCGPNRGIMLLPDFWPGAAFLKFRSGTSAYPVAQAERRQFAVAVETDGTTPATEDAGAYLDRAGTKKGK